MSNNSSFLYIGDKQVEIYIYKNGKYYKLSV